jgi:HAD superfamily hydrolase (TIGR01509 family)
MPRLVLFLDDGGVMNDNRRRGPQWQQLLGEFFPPILGGTPAAWAEANRVVAERLWDDHVRMIRGGAVVDYAAFHRASELAWIGGMCEFVGVPMPPEEESLDLAARAAAYVTRRVRSAFPGVVEAIRTLHAQGYWLHTASGERSADLRGYLEGMGVRECFGRLYGPDLVSTLKGGPEYYARIFADAGVAPADALVIDDSPDVADWVVQAGARLVLVGSAAGPQTKALLTIDRLADLPNVIEHLE